MTKRIVIMFILVLCCCNIYAQADTLLCYDVNTKTTTLIPPPEIPFHRSFDHTGWNLGTSDGVVTLDTSKPGQTYPGSGFTDLFPARLLFNIEDFPIRTAVKIFRVHDGENQISVSGIMISPNHVLTTAHTVMALGSWEFYDSLFVAPAYDNRTVNPLYGTISCKKYYVPRPLGDLDIALVELNAPVGDQTGWIGIAFHDNLDFYKDKVCHILSYPVISDHDRYFNGDTLFYRYGTLDFFRHYYVAYFGYGYGGESGSSLFFTDNEVYYSFGVLDFCGYKSSIQKTITTIQRIDKELFYAFKDIIVNNPTSVKSDKVIQPESFSLKQNYPNPFNPTTVISYQLSVDSDIELSVYNITGQRVATLVSGIQAADEYKVRWNAEGLPSGIYFARLQAGDVVKTMKLILNK